jgi:phospholipid-binding lipoprotein MlaA
MRTRFALLALLVSLLAFPLAARATTKKSDNDPFEAVNRRIFAMNVKLDRWILERIGRGWNSVVPAPAQHAIERFFYNLDTPTVLVNDLLQAKPKQAAVTLTRFAFNSTIGVLGFFDPATAWGLERSDEEFGQTLGYWGVPPGPYLMMPIFGPYTVRDGVGVSVDWATAIYPLFTTTRWTIGPTIVEVINWRAESLDEIATMRESSVDFYVAVRNGYLQHREALVANRRDVDVADEEDLYFFDEEEDFEEEDGDE